jgi:hypothetical protein
MPRQEQTDLTTWQPVDPAHGAAWFSSVEVPWWIAGGWALDLHLGRQSRVHVDLDVGIRRCDIATVRERFTSWEMFEAKDGILTPLDPGEVPRFDVHSLWCRPVGASHWMLELMLDDSVGDAWVYRRLSSIRRPFSTAVRRCPSGLSYLAPEIQLLYKARCPRPRDHVDFELVAPLLDADARAWLVDALHRAEPGHPWISAL